jgi:chromosome segregation ATPase
VVARSAPVIETQNTTRKIAATASAPVSEEGRMDILMQELMSEQQALDVKRKALRSPRAEVDLAPADKQKLTDDIQRHEENIKALGRELEQTRQSMTAATRTAMKSAAQKSSH